MIHLFGPRREGVPFSVVLPVYNEAPNVFELHRRLLAVCEATKRPFEIVYVDDGSTDGTTESLEAVAAGDPRVKVVRLRRNFGQTAALTAGFDIAAGEVVVVLDADLQNPPEEIPKVLAKIDEGFDVVSGWRKDRRDPYWTRRLPSETANRLISFLTSVSLHDYGCSLKAYRREVLQEIRLYGEMHRFLPALAAMRGARIAEVEVAHAPRRHGVSKYGLGRTVKVLLDLLTVRLMDRYGTKPAYVFGLGGLATLALSAVLGLFAIYRRLFLGGEWVSPVTLLAITLFPLAVMFFLLGFVAEVVVRTYYESQGKAIYAVRARPGAPR